MTGLIESRRCRIDNLAVVVGRNQIARYLEELAMVEVAIKKVGQRDGHERFVLVSPKTREIVTVNDVTEAALRRYFRQHGVSDDWLNQCLTRARRRYEDATRKPVDEHAETQGDLLFQLGLEEDDTVHK